MSGSRSSKWIIALLTCAAIVVAGMANQSVFARGGGGHGGGHHGGGHGHHPYHPSSHHTAHHDHHNDHHHYHHHHHSWHNGGWGPGFWGGLGLGAVGGFYGGNYWGGGYGGYGGGTYVDNSSNNNSTDPGNQILANQNTNGNVASNQPQQQPAQGEEQGAEDKGFAVDDWPELGVVTYAGEYGKSQGMVVVRVVPNSAGAKVGIVPGDVILKLNNEPTPNSDALETALDSAKGNFEATVWDARTGRTSTLVGSLDPAQAETENNDDEASVQENPSDS